jgi:hypothetical protein
LNFFNKFSKKSQISSFIKIRPVEAELFHADKRRDGMTDGHDEANSHFSQFCERALKKPEKEKSEFKTTRSLLPKCKKRRATSCLGS